MIMSDGWWMLTNSISLEFESIQFFTTWDTSKWWDMNVLRINSFELKIWVSRRLIVTVAVSFKSNSIQDGLIYTTVGITMCSFVNDFPMSSDVTSRCGWRDCYPLTDYSSYSEECLEITIERIVRVSRIWTNISLYRFISNFSHNIT